MALIIANTNTDESVPNNSKTSLREALLLATGTPEADTIYFAPSLERVQLNQGALTIQSG